MAGGSDSPWGHDTTRRLPALLHGKAVRHGSVCVQGTGRGDCVEVWYGRMFQNLTLECGAYEWPARLAFRCGVLARADVFMGGVRFGDWYARQLDSLNCWGERVDDTEELML